MSISRISASTKVPVWQRRRVRGGPGAIMMMPFQLRWPSIATIAAAGYRVARTTAPPSRRRTSWRIRMLSASCTITYGWSRYEFYFFKNVPKCWKPNRIPIRRSCGIPGSLTQFIPYCPFIFLPKVMLSVQGWIVAYTHMKFRRQTTFKTVFLISLRDKIETCVAVIGLQEPLTFRSAPPLTSSFT